MICDRGPSLLDYRRDDESEMTRQAPLSYDQNRIKQLDNSSLEHFKGDLVSDFIFERVARLAERDFGGREFSVLDVGGGTGDFADRILDRFPLARVHLLDNAEYQLERNVPHPRKQLHLGSAEDMLELFGETRFDLVCFNYVVHHFVLGSYSRTRLEQRKVLSAGASLLAPGGRVSLVEHLCNSFFRSASSRLMYELTSSQALAPVVKRFGANTAGVGVCFLEEQTWFDDLNSVGFRVLELTREYVEWGVQGSLMRRAMKRLLLLRSFYRGVFWAEAAAAQTVIP